MEYVSKSYRLDEEVVAWLDELKSDYGSVNKGLRAIMAEGVVDRFKYAVPPRVLRPTSGRESHPPRFEERKPLLKPRERKGR